MYKESPAAPELSNIDLSQVAVSQTMGAYAVYLSSIELHYGVFGMKEIHPVVEYAQQVAHDLPIKAKEANNADELYNVGLLPHFGRHMPTIIASKLLSSVVDTSGYEWVPHYIATGNGGSCVLIPANARGGDGKYNLYMAFGEKVADEKGYLRAHPLSQVPINNALYGETPETVASKLRDDTRLTVKVNPNELLARSLHDTETTLSCAPWLSIVPRDELPRWRAQEGPNLPPLVAEIYQAATGRIVLAARQGFSTAIEQNDLLFAYEQLAKYGDYLAEVDARAEHADIRKLITKLCGAGLEQLAISAVDYYHTPLKEYKHPVHFAREGELYGYIAAEKGNIEACNYAISAYEQTFTHALIDTKAVNTWHEQYYKVKQLREALIDTPRARPLSSPGPTVTAMAA